MEHTGFGNFWRSPFWSGYSYDDSRGFSRIGSNIVISAKNGDLEGENDRSHVTVEVKKGSKFQNLEATARGSRSVSEFSNVGDKRRV